MKNFLCLLVLVALAPSLLAQTPGWIDASGGSSIDYTWDLTVDSKGDLCNCGQISGGSATFGSVNLNTGGYMLKYDKNGNVKSGFNFGNRRANSCFTDKQDNVYLVADSSLGGWLVGKVTPSGHRVWTYRLSGRVFTRIVKGPNDNILLLGYGTDNGDFAFITLLDQNTGNEIWTKKFIKTPSSAGYTAYDAATTPSGAIYTFVGAAFSGSQNSPGGGITLYKLDQNGNQLASAHLTGKGQGTSLVYRSGYLAMTCNYQKALSIDSTTFNVYPPQSIYDPFNQSLLAIIDTNLNFVKGAVLGSIGGRFGTTDLAMDDDNNVYVTGTGTDMILQNGDTLFFKPGGYNYMLSFDKNLDHRWTFTPGDFEMSHVVAPEKTKEVFIAGRVNNENYYGSTLVSVGYGDLFTASISSQKPKSSDVNLTVVTKSQVVDTFTRILPNQPFQAFYFKNGVSQKISGISDANGKAQLTLTDVDENSYFAGQFNYNCANNTASQGLGQQYRNAQTQIKMPVITSCEMDLDCGAQFKLSFGKISQDTVVLYDSSFTNWGDIQYLWEFGDGSTSTNPRPNHFYASDGTYQICLKIGVTKGTPQSYCGDTLCKSLSVSGSNSGFHLVVVDADTPTSIDEDLSLEDSRVVLYPNPTAGDEVVLRSDMQLLEADVVLYNMEGRIVKKYQLHFSANTDTRIALPDLDPGLYMLVVQTAAVSQQIRLIKL